MRDCHLSRREERIRHRAHREHTEKRFGSFQQGLKIPELALILPWRLAANPHGYSIVLDKGFIVVLHERGSAPNFASAPPLFSLEFYS
jgi:hypothetical protein